MTLSRRTLVGAAAALPLLPRTAGAQARPRIVILGGGFGGASAARFARDHFPDLDITLIERSRRFTTCPYGNLVLAGRKRIDDITFGYERLAARGVRVVHAEAAAVDAEGRAVRLADGSRIPYDRLIMSPGIDLRWGAIEGYDQAASARMPHGWIPSLQPITVLAEQLRAMRQGGVFVMAIPDNPFRCPPGPYERISMVADYLKRHNPRAKILALDAKNGFSKQPLFQDAWAELYPGMIEWRGASSDGRVTRVDVANMTVETEFGEKVRGDVINVIPPQYAAAIARNAGLAADSGWCPIKPESFESARVPNIHVIGDASIAVPMPKSGFAASSHAKQAIAAAAAQLSGRPVPEAVYFNTCYSHVGEDYGISIVGVFRAQGGRLIEVEGSGGISPRNAALPEGRRAEHRRLEALYADGWYESITREMFALS
ncbi:FAD-dependent oxidoreductase [Roseomonas alkaliterrae]|uniref:NADPH-dependent 2,4-dienoyl-CoA reductase/sulfur reductase-like enzyme n=1 Tax=Neoroseomonas alkaliterrae TaxID=1452450 RepID=A0A840Y8J0_9PROT|nr:NAD(P)/FAD-dependent oxidoreductase [Neoroseomonas alkaliterrae]MBB5690184.1 NADPH-dependent 2,4-dienoyl-CoA reductase/sulfur reductase-like enzyme [Neoroseomonas alkaliterrae]MBR0674772.1 FAD-dependent oxidoreductase [Neoroseomonas alkaliterrae]